MDIAKYLIEGLFAVVLCGIGFFLKEISAKLEKLTDAIAALKVEMIQDFVTKSEWEQLRTRFHDLSGTIGRIDQWQRFHDDDDSVRQKLVAIDHTMTELSEKLYKEFVTKEEWEAIRLRLHDLNTTVAGLMAVAELERRKEPRR
jgi:hypothetical protein